MSARSVRAFCRVKWGPEWFKTDKKTRKKAAKDALSTVAPTTVWAESDIDAAKALLAYTDDTKYPIPVECNKCRRVVEDAHVFIAPSPCYYPVGCTHTAYDGEEWCDDCVTLLKDKNGDPVVSCTTCAKLDFGRITDPKICLYDPRK
jgi:hypothetical protein